MTGSLTAYRPLDVLAHLAARDGELDLHSVFGGQHLRLRVARGALAAVSLNAHPWPDRAAVQGLPSNLAALRRGSFTLRAPRAPPDDGELGIPVIGWLLGAASNPAEAAPAVDPDARVRLDPEALERGVFAPDLWTFLALAAHGLRGGTSASALAAALGTDPLWTRERLAALLAAGALERASATTLVAARTATRTLDGAARGDGGER
jgi:hypothetical protein